MPSALICAYALGAPGYSTMGLCRERRKVNQRFGTCESVFLVIRDAWQFSPDGNWLGGEAFASLTMKKDAIVLLKTICCYALAAELDARG